MVHGDLRSDWSRRENARSTAPSGSDSGRESSGLGAGRRLRLDGKTALCNNPRGKITAPAQRFR